MAIKTPKLSIGKRLNAAWQILSGGMAGQVTQTSDAGWTPSLGGIFQSLSGVTVTENTALNLSAVWACVQVISDTVGLLPWHVYQSRRTGGRDARPEHPVEQVLYKRPNGFQSPIDFRVMMLKQVLLTGNAYALIERDPVANVMTLTPIPTSTMQVNAKDGILEYIVQTQSEKLTFTPEQILHVRGLGDGLIGDSVIGHAAQSIGLGLAADQFGASFFANSARHSGVISPKTPFPPEKKAEFIKDFREQFQGSGQVGKTLFLNFELDYKAITITPDEAQFLETRQFTITDICRWFRVPPHKVADLSRATFSNIEHQSIEFVTDTILPWVTRFEQEINYKLFSAKEAKDGYFTKMNLNALLRGDQAARAQFYNTMRDLGAMSIDEIRALEDMNPLPEYGDTRLVPMNMMTLESAANNQQPSKNPVSEPKQGDKNNVPKL